MLGKWLSCQGPCGLNVVSEGPRAHSRPALAVLEETHRWSCFCCPPADLWSGPTQPLWALPGDGAAGTRALCAQDLTLAPCLL